MTEPISPRERFERLRADARQQTADVELGSGLVRRYFDMWNTGEGAVADQVLSPRYVDHAHPDVIGPAAARSIAPRFHRAKGRMAPEILGADGEYVAVRNTIHKPHDGKTVALEGTALFRVSGGRIVEKWSWYASSAGHESGRVAREVSEFR